MSVCRRYRPRIFKTFPPGSSSRLAVVQEADVHGVSTRKVDDLVKALGVDGRRLNMRPRRNASSSEPTSRNARPPSGHAKPRARWQTHVCNRDTHHAVR